MAGNFIVPNETPSSSATTMPSPLLDEAFGVIVVTHLWLKRSLLDEVFVLGSKIGAWERNRGDGEDASVAA